jgi:hypothetical protein
MLAALEFAFLITAPVFFIIMAGVAFKRMQIISDSFARTGSDLVFKVTLPCLLFVKLVETDFQRDLLGAGGVCSACHHCGFCSSRT